VPRGATSRSFSIRSTTAAAIRPALLGLRRQADQATRRRGAPKALPAAVPQALPLRRIEDACRLLRISQSTLWRLCRGGQNEEFGLPSFIANQDLM